MKQFRLVEILSNSELVGCWRNCDNYTIEEIKNIVRYENAIKQKNSIKNWYLEYREV